MSNPYEALLTQSRDHFAIHGGLKRTLSDPAGNTCAYGSMKAAYWDSSFITSIYEHSLRIMADVVREQYPDRQDTFIAQIGTPEGRIASFNDHEDTTKDQVLAVFDKAIVKAREIIG